MTQRQIEFRSRKFAPAFLFFTLFPSPAAGTIPAIELAMEEQNKTGKWKFYGDLARLLWAELKTINVEKIRNSFKLLGSYMRLKRQERLKHHR